MKIFLAIIFTIPTFLYAGIFGIDNRYEVTETNYPYSAIGRIQIGNSHCTGTLIGPCQILTAGHCLVSDATGRPYHEEKIFTPHGSNESSKIVLQYWGTPQNHNTHEENDWSIAILDKSLGNKQGWFGIQKQSHSNEVISSLKIAGYNGDLFSGKKLTIDEDVELHHVYSNNIMSLKANTFSGASGAAIWQLNQDNRPTIIGIHVGAMMKFDQKLGKNTQIILDEYNESKKADGVATSQFWSTLTEVLKYNCPKN